MVEGKLSFDSARKTWKIVFYNEKKKTVSTLFCRDKSQFSDNLTLDESLEIEVEFERLPNGDAIKIRPKGQPWQSRETVQPVDRNPVPQPPGYGDRNRRDVQNQPRNNFAQSLKGEFHNPYNFVPALLRGDLENGLEDAKPIGHDKFHEGFYSGKLTVKMTVETPLVVLDTAKMKIGEKDHKSFPVRIENGRPFINPTSVKGMLRSAYEAVTDSRMSVFKDHNERLAFRAEVNEGLFVIPARIEGAKGSEKIVFYTGKSQIEDDGGPKIIQEADRKNRIPEIRQSQYAAWIRMYEIDDYNTVNSEKVFAMARDKISLENTSGDNPKYPKKVWAWIEEFEHSRRPFTYLKVREIAYDQADLSTSLSKTFNAISTAPEKVEGYICNTGKTMKGKHDERFFFGKNSTYDIDLEKHHIDFWNRLIKNYRNQHENDFDSPPKEKTRDGVEYSLEWSRHIQRTSKEETSEKADLIDEKLKDGTLCYARVKRIGATFEVLELYPVMISRRLHKVSPSELLSDKLKPAKLITQLSPADRVFGWVRQSKPNDNEMNSAEKEIGAHRGQIRIGSIICQTEKEDTIQEFDNFLTMNILGQPKPQQGRFYVAETNKTGESQIKKRSNEDAGYKVGRGLRGRKVYPHHANLPNNYWTVQNGLQEYLRPNGEKDNQNRSIEGWVNPQTVFEFDIHFTNLSKVELGALVWLLDLPEKHFHRFGGAKPYGFGSVKLEIVESDVRDGKDLKTFYMSLDGEKVGKLEEDAVKKLRNDFKNLADTLFPTIIKSFLRACQGFADKPTHYPRKRRELNADTKSFDWFVANSKIDKGTVKHGYVLQDLETDDGLPYFERD